VVGPRSGRWIDQGEERREVNNDSGESGATRARPRRKKRILEKHDWREDATGKSAPEIGNERSLEPKKTKEKERGISKTS